MNKVRRDLLASVAPQPLVEDQRLTMCVETLLKERNKNPSKLNDGLDACGTMAEMKLFVRDVQFYPPLAEVPSRS